MSDERNSVEYLVSSIDKKAEAERQTILDEARKSAAAISAEADATIADLRRERELEYEQKLRSERDRIIGSARVDRRTELLAHRRQLLERVFQEAQGRLEQLPDAPDYGSVLLRLLTEAIALLDTPRVRVYLSSSDAALITDRLRERLNNEGVEVEWAREDTPPGSLRVTDSSEQRVIHAGIQSRMKRARETLVTEVAAILFDDSGA